MSDKRATEWLREAETQAKIIKAAQDLVRQAHPRRRYSHRRSKAQREAGVPKPPRQEPDPLPFEEAVAAVEKAVEAARVYDAAERQRQRAEATARRAAHLRQSVYVIGCDGQPLKIGVATTPAKRLKEIQTGFPHKLRVYFHLEAWGALARKVEQECHRRLSDKRLNGEWFDCHPDEAIALVQKVADRLRLMEPV